MGDDPAVHKLIDILTVFYTEGKPFEEDLTFSITREFLENLRGVLFSKNLVSRRRWEHFFQICYYRMQPTPEMYLRNVIYACRQCASIHLNIFERFLSMFAIILHLRVVTFDKTEVQLSKLIPNIFMALYETELKKPFRRCGGFRRFVEYINNPKYLASNLIGKYATLELNRKAPAEGAMEDLEKQVNILFSEEKELPKDFRLEDAQVDRPSINLAQKILKSAKTDQSSFPYVSGLEAKLQDLPQKLKRQLTEEKGFEAKGMGLNLPSPPGEIMNAKLPTLQQHMMRQLAEEKKVLQVINKHLEIPSSQSDVAVNSKVIVFSQTLIGQLAEEKKTPEVNASALKIELDRSLTSDIETNVILGQLEDNTHVENILQAVIRYNRSMHPGQGYQNKGLLKEACGILENLKGKIETLIRFLDEYDKE